MSNERLVIAFFANQDAAVAAAKEIKKWRKSGADDRLGAIGILVKDADGKVEVHKVGKRKTSTGLAIGALAGILSGGLTLVGGAIGGAVIGHLFHANIKLSDKDKARINNELDKGKAAVCITAKPQSAELIAAKLAELGGLPEIHDVPDQETDEPSPSTKSSGSQLSG